MALPINRRQDDDVIQAQSLGTTTTAGVGAAISGLGGAVFALLPEVSAVKVALELQVSGLVVVGLAIIAWGIATAGDALARAYATAHVGTDGRPLMETVLENVTFGVAGVQNDGSDSRKPALAAAVQRLAEAHENATFGVVGVQNDGSDSKKPALAEAVKELGARDGVGVKQQVVEAPRGLTFDDGQQSFKVAALIFPRAGFVQQLYFDESNRPHLTEVVEIAQ